MNISQLQESEVFFEDLKRSITKAKKRIWIQVMLFEFAPEMEIYISALAQAAQRGVDVHLVVDWITQRYYGDNLDVYPPVSLQTIKTRKRVQQLADQVYARLRKVGVRVTIAKTPSFVGRIFLLGRRNHNKIFIIDDTVWVGGINFIANPHRYRDFMVKIQDQNILSPVIKFFSHPPEKDLVFPCGKEYTLLMDSGRKGHSGIYDAAVDLIRHAEKEIVFVSQMLPDSNFLNALLEASNRNVEILAIISNAEHNIFTKFPFRYHYSRFQEKIQHNPRFRLIHSHEWIHAKLLVVDAKALFGSHNFAKWNELIGIEETDFLTTDTHLLRQFSQFAENLMQ